MLRCSKGAAFHPAVPSASGGKAPQFCPKLLIYSIPQILLISLPNVAVNPLLKQWKYKTALILLKVT